MPTCPNGHSNPRDQQICQVCDALIVAEPQSDSLARGLRWVIVSAGVVALVLAGVLVGLLLSAGRDTVAAPDDNVAIQQWWSTAREPFEAMQAALDDAETSLRLLDKPGLAAACEQMHDSAVVGLKAQLPAPDPRLTAEIEAAAEDFHSAAHMCLSVITGSLNSYDGEFMSTLDQAEKHLDAALAMVYKRSLGN